MKKNLPERVSECRPYLLEADDSVIDARAAAQDKHFLDLSQVGGKQTELEIGCGKGGFALQYAQAHPNIKLVAVEKLTNVIISGAEAAKELAIDNLRFLRSGAEYLPRFFPDGSISRIYLNFPCPFNKEAYHDRRLTYAGFLKIYEQLLVPNGEICLKTDNPRMFAYSMEQFSQYGYGLYQVTLDLHASQWAQNNIITEYESKFIAEGKPIFRAVARKNI